MVWSRRRWTTIRSACFCVALAARSASAQAPVDASAKDATRAEPGPSASAPARTSPSSAAGLEAHIDPTTRELTAGPAEVAGMAEQDPWLRNALSTSSDGLVEEPSPGGGWMIDLQGRFQSVVFATVDASGNVAVQHGMTTAAAPLPHADGGGCKVESPDETRGVRNDCRGER